MLTALPLLMVAVLCTIGAAYQLPRTHPSTDRMRRLSAGSPEQVARMAQQSYKDFSPDYGDLKQDVQTLRQAGILQPGQSLMDALRQTDYTTSTSGILNRIFGRGVWPQVNVMAKVFGHLPKSQRTRGSPLGWRAQTAFGSSGKGGQSQGTVPSAVVGSFTQVSPTPKESSTQYRVSGLHQDMYEIDDAYGSLAELQNSIAIEHTRELERALTEDIDTLAGNNLESIDRVSASSANQATIGWTAGDEDLNGVDRSANTWYNGTQLVDSAGTALTAADLRSLFQQVIAKEARPTCWVSGYDWWEAVTALHEPQGRFNIGVTEQVSAGKVNDADAVEGLGMSPFIGTLYGRPIIGSDLIQQDSNELSRAYLHDLSNPEGMDKPRFGLDMIRPTQVYLAGERTQGAPQNLGFLGDSVLIVTRAEVGVRNARVQGQIRDRTSP